MLAFGFAPELANQRKRPATDSKIPPIMLDPSDLMERVFVKKIIALQYPLNALDQSQTAIIAQHLRMHTGKPRRRFQGKSLCAAEGMQTSVSTGVS